MDNNRLNFIYKLNHIVNENEVGTVEFELAKFFLDNFKSVARWNIYQIAEEKHVSRASILVEASKKHCFFNGRT